MTAKQKANRARFKQAIAEAKKLRKKNPKLTQAQAVKQAWAILYSKKKVSGYSEKRSEIHKNATKWAKQIQKRNPDYDKRSVLSQAYERAAYGPISGIGATKKKTQTKVKAKKGKRTSEMHTDTKSHNVNIRVMSGVNTNMYTIRDNYEKEIKFYLDSINRIKDSLDSMTPTQKGRAAFVIRSYKKIVSKLKKQLKDQNKLINDLLK